MQFRTGGGPPPPPMDQILERVGRIIPYADTEVKLVDVTLFMYTVSLKRIRRRINVFTMNFNFWIDIQVYNTGMNSVFL